MSEPVGAEPADETPSTDATESALPVTTAKKPWWRRASTWVIVVAILIAGSATAWLLSSNDSSATTDTVAAVAFTEVQRTTLEQVTTLDGTLGFVAGEPIVYAGSTDGISTIPAGAGGTITSLPQESSTVEEGEILYTRDEQPVIVFYGEIPAYRTLNTRSSDGDDVIQLEEALTRLGYDEDGDLDLDGDFTTATRDAIKALQNDLEIDDTGVLQMGLYVFVDG
ncbi:MAG: peptidoglycan-binding domain-containing protein, partial [Acidimicrobiia bacterium]